MQIRKILAVLVLASFPLSALAATKSYQVTGSVVESNDQRIVVMKGKEKFEIARDASTKAPAEVKAGDKVTVYYRMNAEEIETKGAKAEKGEKKADKAEKAVKKDKADLKK